MLGRTEEAWGRVSEGDEPINYELKGHIGPIVRHTIRE